jgi:hypothetical protein
MSARTFEAVHRLSAARRARQVFVPSNRLKVGWIDAASDVADVVQLQSVRDFSYGEFIREAVSPHLPSGDQLEPSIPLLIVATDAEPASSIWLWKNQVRI